MEDRCPICNEKLEVIKSVIVNEDYEGYVDFWCSKCKEEFSFDF